MAKQFVAAHRIRAGVGAKDDNGSFKQTKTFEPGDVVAGLDKDTMKKLWDNGAITEKTEESSGSSSTGSEAPSQGEGSKPPAGPTGDK
jgi:hypothetical protein